MILLKINGIIDGTSTEEFIPKRMKEFFYFSQNFVKEIIDGTEESLNRFFLRFFSVFSNDLVTKTSFLMSNIMGREEGEDLLEDLELVKRFKKGNREAFEELTSRYAGRIYNTILRMVKNGHEAEDLTQDTFLQAFKSLQKFQEKSSFYTWIYRIAVNRTLNFLKLKKRKMAMTGSEIDNDEEGVRREVADFTKDPGITIQAIEMRELIEKAVGGLSENNRLVFVLKEMDGFSYSEISSMLNLSPEAVRIRLYRAKKALQEILKEYLEQMT